MPIAGALSGLSARDVARKDRVEIKDSAAKAVYTTFNGLRITLDLTKTW